jgi:hypothetical protein
MLTRDSRDLLDAFRRDGAPRSPPAGPASRSAPQQCFAALTLGFVAVRPKGAGFLWAEAEHQGWIEPLVVSWGNREQAFVDRHAWAGTRDPAAYLTVPTAIDVHSTFDQGAQRAVPPC